MLVRILKVIGSLLLVLIPVYFGFLLTRRVPDVKYTLSEGIPVSFVSSPGSLSETIQQLELKNLGNSAAHDLVIKIDQAILSYDISKYSAADQVNIFDNQRPFEVDYALLPPEASFRVILKSAGNGIAQADLSVSHSDGIGREALSTSNSSPLAIVLPWISTALALVYFFLSLWTLRGLRLSSLKLPYHYKSFEDVVNLKRPFYVSQQAWPVIHRGIFTEKLENDYPSLSGVQHTAPYKFLELEKPSDIDPKKWNELVLRSIREFSKSVAKELRYISETDLIALLRLKKPKYFPEADWSDVRKLMLAEYMNLKTKEYFTVDELSRILHEERPPEIPELSWNDVIAKTRTRFVSELGERLYLTDTPLEYLDKYDLAVLSREQRETLHKEAQKIIHAGTLLRYLYDILHNKLIDDVRPQELPEYEWIKLKDIELRIIRAGTLLKCLDDLIHDRQISDVRPQEIPEFDWINLKELGSRLSKLWQVEDRTNILYGLITEFVKSQTLPETKPNSITVAEWEWLIMLQAMLAKSRRLLDRENEIEQAAQRGAATQAQIKAQQARVEKQLQIIHEALTDPTSLDRIEDYNDALSVGNLANLRIVAQTLKDTAKRGGDTGVTRLLE
jgi:hypothetical protein